MPSSMILLIIMSIIIVNQLKNLLKRLKESFYIDLWFNYDGIRKYFRENTLNLEKILIFKNGNGLDLSGYKKKLKKIPNLIIYLTFYLKFILCILFFI